LPDLQRRWRPHHTEGVSGLSNIGEELRSAREAQGRTIQEASAATRIRPSYLEAIEGERFDELGGNVYAKGFIRSYASYLGVDPAPLLDVYRSEQRPEAPVFERAPRALTGGLGAERRRRGRSSWLLVGIVFVSIVLVASVWSLLKPAPSSSQTTLNPTPPATAAPTTTPAEPTTTIAPKPKGVTLVLRYVGASWTKVAVDGKVSFQGIGNTSERRTFKARHTIDITLGAPGQVKLTVNGKSVVPNRTGTVWHHSFTADTANQGQTTTAQGGQPGSSNG
jgi:cytoskeleton protein RodZ